MLDNPAPPRESGSASTGERDDDAPAEHAPVFGPDAGREADGLDVAAVGIEDEGAVVVSEVVGSEAGRAVAFAAGGSVLPSALSPKGVGGGRYMAAW